tara:strand:- start:224 stop:451 length:228 start_codon:yes stop_codon:yes gene_type:complete
MTSLQSSERQTLKAHIVWLGNELEKSRRQCRTKTELLQRMMDPDDLGHAVSQEIRTLVYQILIEDSHNEREKWNR